VDATETADAMLDEARTSAAHRAWDRAYDLFSAVATTRTLDPEDLDRFAKAAYWTGRSDQSISMREAAYASYLERGDEHRAALCALTLRREHLSNLQDSVAAGWLKRAEHLLEGRPESFADTSPADGYLAIAHADAARARGDFARALGLVDRALRIADGSSDRNLRAWGVMRRAMFLVDEGRLTEGYRLMEEVAAAATGGELGGYTTGAVFTNMMSLCRDVASYRRGIEWSDAARRWLERQRIEGFPGICRIHRSELLRMLGNLEDAQGEAGRACEEVGRVSMVHSGVAQHELGEVRLRLGDLEGAEEAFGRAQELGEDPQPGLALLRLAQGDVIAALASIGRSLEGAAFDGFARARMLSAQAEIAVVASNAERARQARDELGEIAGQIPSPAVRAASEWSSGLLALLEVDPETASRHLREARDQWSAVSAPYETAKAEVALAEAELVRGDRDGAAAQLQIARATFERLGATRDARRTADLEERLRRGGSPTRTVRTFLFTDIVSSTSLLGLIGDDAWDDLRRWHDQTLRACFVDHGGEEIDHAGDGFFVAFPDATSALASAIEIQRRLAEHRRAHGFAPQVRMGLHATAATHDSGDYTGLGVHTAARISSLAGSGEILASAETIEGVPAVRTSEARTAHLKGIAEPVDVVVVEWRD
jgi:class 3 adenylate cyclase